MWSVISVIENKLLCMPGRQARSKSAASPLRLRVESRGYLKWPRLPSRASKSAVYVISAVSSQRPHSSSVASRGGSQGWASGGQPTGRVEVTTRGDLSYGEAHKKRMGKGPTSREWAWRGGGKPIERVWEAYWKADASAASAWRVAAACSRRTGSSLLRLGLSGKPMAS